MSESIRILHLASALSGEGIKTFSSESILITSGDDGPRLRRPLPSGSEVQGHIPPGDYVFWQWRDSSYPTIEDGFEDFVRQLWWEGKKTEGPWILRVVVEDGHTACQGLRLIGKT